MTHILPPPSRNPTVLLYFSSPSPESQKWYTRDGLRPLPPTPKKKVLTELLSDGEAKGFSMRSTNNFRRMRCWISTENLLDRDGAPRTSAIWGSGHAFGPPKRSLWSHFGRFRVPRTRVGARATRTPESKDARRSFRGGFRGGPETARGHPGVRKTFVFLSETKGFHVLLSCGVGARLAVSESARPRPRVTH